MTVITTVGTAERHLPAERATLVARVSVSDADRATAIAAATALHNRLAARANSTPPGTPPGITRRRSPPACTSGSTTTDRSTAST